MITVYFEDTFKESSVIGYAHDVDGAYYIIHCFLADNSYTSYYQRAWQCDGKTFVDVGSYSEKFWLDKEVLH